MKQALQLLILLFLASCQSPQPQQTDVFTLNLHSSIGKSLKSDYTFNGDAKNIEYIPINDCDIPMGVNLSFFGVDNNNFYIRDVRYGTIFIVDKETRNLSSFSRVGRGPEEYSRIGYAYVDSETSLIHVFENQIMATGKHLTYNTEGKCIAKEFLSERGIGEPIFHSNQYNVMKSPSRGDAKHQFFITDNNFNIKQKIFPIDSLMSQAESLVAINGYLVNTSNKDIAIIGRSDLDTVFTVKNDKVEPLLVLKRDKYRFPSENIKGVMNPLDPYIQTIFLHSIAHNYLITYMFEGVFYFDVWQKNSGELIARFDNSNGEYGYPFELPTGRKIKVIPQYTDENNMYFILQAPALVDVIDGVKEDDNPVIIHVTF